MHGSGRDPSLLANGSPKALCLAHLPAIRLRDIVFWQRWTQVGACPSHPRGQARFRSNGVTLSVSDQPGSSGPLGPKALPSKEKRSMSPYPHLSESLPQLATPDEVEPLLGMTRAGVIRQCRAGRLPGVKVGGRWLVHVRELAAQFNADDREPADPRWTSRRS